MNSSFTIQANLVDAWQKRIYPAHIAIADGKIAAITEAPVPEGSGYIMPGFVDAHIHIESSMLVPTEFARLAVTHGTVATVSDPHEIANVCGMAGVQYMIDNSKKTPFKFFFGAPSCVPATMFETAGGIINATDIETLLSDPDIWYLTEMMNYPGVLYEDAAVMAKLDVARKMQKPIDGHAPGLRGADVIKYAAAGISTDHECFTIEEATDKLNAGMHILIREGSAAKNFEALAPLIPQHAGKLMFCSDDKHPDDLVLHHIDHLVKRALAKGYDLFDVLRISCVNPVLHYKIPVGLLREGDPADFIIINSIEDFKVEATFINGIQVSENGVTRLTSIQQQAINQFNAQPKTEEDFSLKINTNTIRVIEALDGQLITNELILPAKTDNGYAVSDIDNDILKICVVNRYDAHAAPAIAFVKNFGLKKGALASTIAHDCHNIIAVGTTDASIAAAVNALIAVKGGIAVAEDETLVTSMPLPVAGLMSTEDGYKVAAEYTGINLKAKALGTSLHSPFMTLSFMALLVIPSLKLSDKGLFDGNSFSFTTVSA